MSEAARLDSVHRGMVVANTINTRWSRQVQDIRADLSAAMNLLQGAFQRIELLAETGPSSEVLSAMQNAVQPEESELSQQLVMQVSDILDFDHI